MSYRCRNESTDHHDLQRVVHEKARNHRIGEDSKRLPPGQWRQSGEPYEGQDGPDERVGHDRPYERRARYCSPEPAAFPRRHDREYRHVEQGEEAEGVERIIVGGQAEMPPADP